jgi:hypothetical protein
MESDVVSPLLRDITVAHGPTDVIGRLFIKADMAARTRGITLVFGSFEEMEAVNFLNRDSWANSRLMPQFDPGVADGLFDENSFCIFGISDTGQIVATQAARLYDMTNSNLRDEAESLRLFYGQYPPPEGVSCSMPAISANIKGKVVYSGSGWYHPDFRGKQLSSILPRISRAYALTRWDTDFTVSLLDRGLVQAGIADRYGYTKRTGDVIIRNMIRDQFIGMVAWMPRDELIRDAEQFIEVRI